jgi:hypothetical protein
MLDVELCYLAISHDAVLFARIRLLPEQSRGSAQPPQGRAAGLEDFSAAPFLIFVKSIVWGLIEIKDLRRMPPYDD